MNKKTLERLQGPNLKNMKQYAFSYCITNYLSASDFMTKTTTFNIPIKTVSESNSSENWVKKAHRHKIQKWLVRKVFCDNQFEFKLPLIITMIRIAPKSLDQWDNLPMSMKWILDQICAEITKDFRPGRADDNKGITVKYDQRKGKVREYYVEVTIEES
jgi:hypothetical protein